VHKALSLILGFQAEPSLDKRVALSTSKLYETFSKSYNLLPFPLIINRVPRAAKFYEYSH
jgi:hypothetical protein